jgi:hypothetical protein
MITENHKRKKADVAAASWQALTLHATFWMLPLVLLGLLLASPNSAAAAARQAGDLDGTIQHLISYVRKSDVTFQRNLTRHGAIEAAAHIEKKYEYFRDKIETPEEFIELCATASLMTGKPYLIIDRQGNEMPAGAWLNAELVRYRVQNSPQ